MSTQEMIVKIAGYLLVALVTICMLGNPFSRGE